MDGVAQVAAHFSVLSQRGGDVRLESLNEAMPSAELSKRMLLIEFGDDAAVFEALAPEVYLYRGKLLRAEEVDLNLL